MNFVSDNNKAVLTRVVSNITMNTSSELDKARVVFEWFNSTNGNMQNVYGKNLLFEYYPLEVYTGPPYFCIRLIGHDNPLWILTTRCGACDEYALLFMEMANEAGLKVRSIHNHGENHNWDEVLVDGRWVIVDPSWPKFNPPPSFYDKNRVTANGDVINLSYAYALYPNGDVEDVTERYTNVGTLEVKAVDERGRILSNVRIHLLSNNYVEGKYTGLNCITDGEGTCVFSLGGGNYTLISRNDEIPPLYNQTSVTIEENKLKSIEVILKKDISMIPIPSRIYAISFSVILWVLLVFYLSLIRLELPEVWNGLKSLFNYTKRKIF